MLSGFLQFLDSEESIQRLRDYAAYRFRDQDLEQAMLFLQEEERIKRERRANTRAKNKHIKEIQKQKDLELWSKKYDPSSN